jgi:hypothetical protein
VPEASEIDGALRGLEVELHRLEIEYNAFFAGRLPRPPWEMRSRVDTMVKHLDRETSKTRNYADRFRFLNLQARFATFADLWDRGLKAQEEGRPGPFSRTRRQEIPSSEAQDRIVRVTVFSNPLKEMEKLKELYQSVSDARDETGAPQIPFHKFARFVREHVTDLKKKGAPDVAFRLAIRDGKIKFTARALKGTARRRPPG